VEIPRTRWARTGDGVDIAYQDLGEGDVTILLLNGLVSHLEVYWEQPRYERFMRRLATGMRVLVMDSRGIGMSDRVTGTVDLETRADDLGTVMDDAGVDRAALLAWGVGGQSLAAFFAAVHPERTVALCIDPNVQMKRTAEWPFGFTQDSFEKWLIAELAIWGDDVASGYDDVPDEPGFAAWDAKLGRYAATPASYESFARTLFDTDVTDVLASIRVPTLILAKQGSSWANPEQAAFVSARIAGSLVVTTPGNEGVIWVDEPEPLVAAVESFLGLQPPAVGADRVLATILFTDIVGSTAAVASIGDASWSALLAQHDRQARAEVARFRGRYIVSTGDGLLATFDGPARAVRCAVAIGESIRRLGLEIRSGCHTGEVEFVPDNISGIAVHIAARVASRAEAGEVLVSSTVKDLVVGSGLEFMDRGVHELKGVTGSWQLHALAR
jgi:class 3 adenylate cyclase